jgi:hypothetical protein
MDPIARTVSELFPDSSYAQPLRVFVPPRLHVSARMWNRIVALMAFVALLSILVGWIGSLVDADGLNELLGGTGVTYSDDGDPWALAGTWLERLLWLSAIGAVVVYGLLRMSVQAPWRRDRRQDWRHYGAERGLTPGGPSPASTGLAVFNDGRDRDWHGVHVGRLAGDVPVTVGATAWTTGSGKSKERHHVSFALVELPAEVGELFPGATLTRFLRGLADLELHDGGFEELRLESTAVDVGCEIRVKGDQSEIRWRELFDPVTIHGLATWYDAQWQQRGRWLVCLAGGSRIGSAPVETIDTLCLTAAFMHARYVRAAQGDVIGGAATRTA